jgi:AbrB family looped-hinge helix DNA binding protein
MIRQKMKVGTKGQVVIPKIFRENMGIRPGSVVVFEMTSDGLLIERPAESAVAVFERIAKSGKPVKRIDADKDYEEMLEERWKRKKHI